MYQLGLEWVIYLGSESSNRHFYNVRVAVKIHIPNLRDNLRTAQYHPGVTHQVVQQREFFGGQINTLTVPECPVPALIKFQIGHANDLHRCGVI
ncbi:hypothetical protein D3C81_2136700 [compost metagenome]